MTYQDLLARAQALPYTVPTDANRLARFPQHAEQLAAMADGVRPILHPRTHALLDDVLAWKRQHGHPAERTLYADLTPSAYITRLLHRRPLCFLTGSDHYLLPDGTQDKGGFDRIGTPAERDPLTLTRFLSYDDMAVSALLGVSVPTRFINDGARRNRAQPGPPGSFETEGVYVGLVGARFERTGLMEWQHCVVTSQQNTPANGYGPDADPSHPRTQWLRLWANAYGLPHFPTWEDVRSDPRRFHRLPVGETALDADAYRARIELSLVPFFADADDRARQAERRAYVHMVGLGLGVWELLEDQQQWFADAAARALQARPHPCISDLDFSWFSGIRCGDAGHGDVLPGTNVRIHVSVREPAAKLTGEHDGKLVVASYAWDSNAYPGNEYWGGSLSASGDPAAACCSLIPELQNPDVNPRVHGDHAWIPDPPSTP